MFTEDAFRALSAWVTEAGAAAEASGDPGAFPNVEVTLLQGGAVSAVASNATAYPHRNAVFLVQYGMEWTTPEASQGLGALVDKLEATLAGYAGPAPAPMYVNYMDDSAELPSFYGPNLGRLQEVKAAYDGGNFFKSPMSVPPAEGAQPTDDDSASALDSDPGARKDGAAGMKSGALPQRAAAAAVFCSALVLTF